MRGEKIPENNQANIGKRDRAENQQMPVNIARRDALIAGQGFLNVIVKRPVPSIDKPIPERRCRPEKSETNCR